MKTYSFIFARGGSKGLPKKNIMPLNGKPLIGYSIELAREIEEISGIFVSTDDEEISKLGQAEGAIVVHRPAELSTDTASSLSVLQHTLSELSKTYKKIEDLV